MNVFQITSQISSSLMTISVFSSLILLVMLTAMTKSSLREEQVYLPYRAQSMVEGETKRCELKSLEECCLLSCSTTFFFFFWTSNTQDWSLMDQAFLCQLATKTVPTDLQSIWMAVIAQLRFSSQVCLGLYQVEKAVTICKLTT